MNDMQLRQEIIEELDFEPGIDSRGIAVSVAGGVVTLSGHVPSYSQKVDAEKAVWRIKGVKALAQEIEVRLAEDAKVNDDEIATRAARILAWSSAVPTDSIRVKVSHAGPVRQLPRLDEVTRHGHGVLRPPAPRHATDHNQLGCAHGPEHG